MGTITTPFLYVPFYTETNKPYTAYNIKKSYDNINIVVESIHQTIWADEEHDENDEQNADGKNARNWNDGQKAIIIILQNY